MSMLQKLTENFHLCILLNRTFYFVFRYFLLKVTLEKEGRPH